MVISQVEAEESESGTYTSPLVVCVIKFFTLRRDPSTSPLTVLIVISPPSQLSKETSPLVLLINKSVSQTTSSREISPLVDTI